MKVGEVVCKVTDCQFVKSRCDPSGKPEVTKQ